MRQQDYALIPPQTLARAKRRRQSRIAHRVIGIICAAAVLIGLFALVRRGINEAERVERGEITVAQMLSSIGAWLRGEADGDGSDMEPPTLNAPQMPPTQNPDPGTTAQDPYAFDASSIPKGARGIRPVDLWSVDYDRTGVSADAWQIPAISITPDAPLVLVLHSHTGEGYTPGDIAYVGAGDTVGRPNERAASVLGAGEVLTLALEEQGITCIHLDESFDSTSNAGAFDRAAEAVARTLLQYPSIRFVIDLHRDARLDESGNVVQAICHDSSTAIAQMRLLAPDESNALALVSRCAALLNRDGAHLCYEAAAVRMSEAWQLDGAWVLRVELGTVGNTPEQAAQGARALADALTCCIKP